MITMSDMIIMITSLIMMVRIMIVIIFIIIIIRIIIIIMIMIMIVSESIENYCIGTVLFENKQNKHLHLFGPKTTKSVKMTQHD